MRPLARGMDVFCCECCVLSGRGLYNELITHPDESCQLWCIIVCDLETSIMGRTWPQLGGSAIEKIFALFVWPRISYYNLCFDNNLFPDNCFVPIGPSTTISQWGGGGGAVFLAAVASYIHACKHRKDLQFFSFFSFFLFFSPIPWKANWIQSCYLVGLTLLIDIGILVYPSQIFIFIQNASELLFIPLHVY
jgi:hypothetical protein